MQGRRGSGELLFDPEIEKTAKANRKAVRLSRSVPPTPRPRYTSPTPSELESIPSPKSDIMGDNDPPPPPPRPMMGDYGLDANRGHLTHVFQPANPVAFDIKSSVQQNLRENQFDGCDDKSPCNTLNSILLFWLILSI